MVPNSEVEVVVSPTGRQRLQSQAQAGGPAEGRRAQPTEYSGSKYKVYERPNVDYDEV